VFSQHFSYIKSMMKSKIENLFPDELLEIRKIFDKVGNYKFVLLSREPPLEYERYMQYLHDSSYPILKKIT
jgi:hypothetical protein